MHCSGVNITFCSLQGRDVFIVWSILEGGRYFKNVGMNQENPIIQDKHSTLYKWQIF